jgi:ComF family protein
VWAWGNYDGDLKRAIAAFKYQGRIDLAQPLGHAIADAWLGDRPNPDTVPRRDQPWVVPIPLFAAKEEQRGFNQAAELAAAFCEITGLHHAPYGLQRVRNTQAQFGLSARDRQRNLQAAFTLGPDCQNPRWWGLWPRRLPRRVIVVDDIYTTGATIRTAIACFQQHQIQVTDVVVLSRTLPRQAIAPPAQDRKSPRKPDRPPPPRPASLPPPMQNPDS